jgi:hypothetical protein
MLMDVVTSDGKKLQTPPIARGPSIYHKGSYCYCRDFLLKYYCSIAVINSLFMIQKFHK